MGSACGAPGKNGTPRRRWLPCLPQQQPRRVKISHVIAPISVDLRGFGRSPFSAPSKLPVRAGGDDLEAVRFVVLAFSVMVRTIRDRRAVRDAVAVVAVPCLVTAEVGERCAAVGIEIDEVAVRSSAQSR